MTHTDLHEFLAKMAGLGRTTILVREDGLRVILLRLKAGETIPEHQTRGAITIQGLTGEATLMSSNERIQIRQAQLASLAPGAPHSVTAQTDTLLLVTIWEPARSDSHEADG